MAHVRAMPLSAHHLLNEVPWATKPARTCCNIALSDMTSRNSDQPEAVVGDILTTDKLSDSKMPFMLRISRVKALYGVEQDQELARALGTSKAAVASWRRRQELPAWVLAKVLSEFPAHRLQAAAGPISGILNEPAVYAAALAILELSPPPVWAGETADSPQNMLLRAHVLLELVEAIALHVKRVHERDGLQMDAVALFERCLADFHASVIPGVDKALFRDIL